MPKTPSRRVAKISTSRKDITKQLRELQVEIKAVRRGLARAVQTEAELRKLRELIVSDFNKWADATVEMLKLFQNEKNALEIKVSKVESDFEERVKAVADRVVQQIEQKTYGPASTRER